MQEAHTAHGTTNQELTTINTNVTNVKGYTTTKKGLYIQLIRERETFIHINI